MKWVPVIAGLGLAMMLSVTACGTPSTNAPAPTTTPQKSVTTPTAAPKTVNLTMKVITGKMANKPGWPRFVPANATLPKNAIVNVTIHNYDDGNAPIPSGYNKVKGTIGRTMNVDGHTYSSIPVSTVAHTFTISSIGLNVPIQVRSASEKFDTVTFSFKTPSTAQTLTWQCYAACGTGTSGWQGPMMANGWMKGTLTIS